MKRTKRAYRPPLSRQHRLDVLAAISLRATQPQAARAVGCSTNTVQRILYAAGGKPPRRSQTSAGWPRS